MTFEPTNEHMLLSIVSAVITPQRNFIYKAIRQTFPYYKACREERLHVRMDSTNLLSELICASLPMYTSFTSMYGEPLKEMFATL